MTFKSFVARLCHFVKDSRCVVCNAPLEIDENGLCEKCANESGIFDTFQLQLVNNPIEMRLHGTRISSASALMSYEKDEAQQRLVHDLKYRDERKIAIPLGKAMAERIMRDARYEGIDYIVPVPLHPNKKSQRGYNQSELIAREVSRRTGIPLVTNQLTRKTDNESQAGKDVSERMKAQISFEIKEASFFESKRVLLIDDVFTTGSTIINCAEAFDRVKEMDIKVYVLASPLGCL